MRFIKYELETVPQYAEANRIFKDPNATPQELQRASKIYLGYGDVGSRFKYAQTALKGLGGYTPGSRGVAGTPGKSGTPGVAGKPGVDGKPGVSAVTAAPTQQQLQQQVAQQVSQPVITQSQPQVNILPLNMSGQGNQGTQRPPTTSVGKASGNAVPFFPSTNTDNFLTLYSKIVYNIVDA
jgi:hypothetical protein